MRLTNEQQAVLRHMKLFRTDEGWEYEVPTYTIDGERHISCGPYQNKQEADEDRRGLCVTLEGMIRDGSLDRDWWKRAGEQQEVVPSGSGDGPLCESGCLGERGSIGRAAVEAAERCGQLLLDRLTTDRGRDRVDPYVQQG